MEILTINTPICPISVTIHEDKLQELCLSPKNRNSTPSPPTSISPLALETTCQLEAYFSGRLQVFHLPFHLNGTAFQEKIWNALTEIPYGSTCSYADLAEITGTPKGFRAVGNANGKNPLPILIPCHRVISKNGSLGGYSGGLHWKQFLLSLESGSHSPI